MANIQWPVSICPLGFSLTLEANSRSFRTGIGSEELVTDLLEDSWKASVSVDATQGVQAAAVEALGNRLAGGFDTVNLYHFARPLPRGTARVSRGLLLAVAKGGAEVTVSVEPNATLLIGDMLKVGNLLLQAAQNCVADALGVITVPVVNRLREALSGYSRSSTARYLDSAGVMQTAGIGVARWQSTSFYSNLALYSEDFANSAWGKNQVTLLGSQTAGGISNATLVTATSLGNDFVSQPIRLPTAAVATTTWRVFPGTATAFHLMRRTSTEANSVGFSWVLGVPTPTTVGAGSTVSVVPVSGGWYDVSVTRALGEPQQGCRLYPDSSNGSGSIYVKHAQFEQGAVANQYAGTTNTPAAAGIGSPELLIEPQVTNLFPSTDIATWVLNSGNILTGATTLAPDGTNTAHILTNAGTRYRSIAVSAGTSHTFSLFVRPVDSGLSFRLYRDGAGGAGSADVQLAGGTLSALVSGTASNPRVHVLGGGWFRLAVTFACSAAGSGAFHVYPISANADAVWGPQVELGSEMTSYIPTSGVAQTRAADTLEPVVLVKPTARFRLSNLSDTANDLTTLQATTFLFEEAV